MTGPVAARTAATAAGGSSRARGRAAQSRAVKRAAGTVLFLESKSEEKRFLFEAARRLGCRVALASRGRPGWEAPLIDDFVPLPGEDAAAVVEACRAYAARHRVRAVIAFLERYVELGAGVAAALGLPGLDPGAARAVRDKHVMRTRLEAAGVPQPRFALAATADQALAALERVGLPAVMKPVAGWASHSVVKVGDAAEAAGAFRVVQASSLAKFGRAEVLVEEYLEGPELSVESVSAGGEPRVVAVTDKPLPMEGPHFMELEHVTPSSLDEGAQSRLRELTRRALLALGVGVGGSHVEWRLTGRGPRLLEAAGRLGGNHIPRLVELATGVDMGELVVRAHLGERPGVRPRPLGAAGVRFLLAPASGRLVSVQGLERARSLPGMLEAEVYLAPGGRLRAPQDRLLESQYYLYAGHLLASGPGPAEVRRTLELGAAAVCLEVEAEGGRGGGAEGGPVGCGARVAPPGG